MRRSSCVVIALVVLLLVALAVLLSARDRVAGPMSQERAQALLDRGRGALARHDVEGIVSLFTPDAIILDRSPDQMRQVLATLMQELGPAALDARISHLDVVPAGNSAVASFDVDVDEQPAGAHIHYYHAHFRATLVKVEQPRWLGLYNAEQWKISRLDSDTDLNVPTP